MKIIDVGKKSKVSKQAEVNGKIATKQQAKAAVSYPSYQTKKHIIALAEDGVEGYYRFSESFTDSEVDKLLAYDPNKIYLVQDPETKEDVIYFIVDNGKLMLTPKSKGTVQTCVYSAIDNYLSSILGVKLSNSDRTWFSYNPLVSDFGVTPGDSLHVAAGLVAPYGLGVSHVWYPKGHSVPEPLHFWMDTLGVNPPSLATRDVSNSEYANMLPDDLKPTAYDYHFEFVDRLPREPMVFLGSSSSINGAGGGHASYRAPRDGAIGIWDMSFSLDYLGSIGYNIPLPSFEYKVAYVPSLWQSEINGKTITNIAKTVTVYQGKYQGAYSFQGSPPYTQNKDGVFVPAEEGHYPQYYY